MLIPIGAAIAVILTLGLNDLTGQEVKQVDPFENPRPEQQPEGKVKHQRVESSDQIRDC